jgi:gliding motility-associated-like protein
MRIILTFLSILFLSGTTFAQKYTVSGGTSTPYSYGDNLNGTNIEQVYLFNGLNGAKISYSSSAVSVVFYRYRQSLADKEQIQDSDISISSSNNSTTYTISNLADSYGYYAEANGKSEDAVWIIDYKSRQSSLTSIEVVENEDKCENLKLFVTKTDGELSFYPKNQSGIKKDIPVVYTLDYECVKWDDGRKEFVPESYSRSMIIGTEIIIDAPLKDTKFVLRGDRFAEYFNIAKQVSVDYQAVAVKGYITSENENGSNEANEENSAPFTVNFYSHANDAVRYYTWLIYNRKDMADYIVRYTDKDIKYTFDQSGDFVIQLEVANAASDCVDTTSVSLNIADWKLEAPNYFSPGGSTGTEFKVSYKSILKFKCTIFNRWGVKIYEWNDPTKGWDGRHNGRYVNTGVYYYVIEYTSSDGKRRKKSGDINVLQRR